MSYLNANDLPEHVRSAFETAVVTGASANVTTRYGTAVIISKDEYDRLCAAENGDYAATYNYKKYGVDSELEGYLRDEIDF